MGRRRRSLLTSRGRSKGERAKGEGARNLDEGASQPHTGAEPPSPGLPPVEEMEPSNPALDAPVRPDASSPDEPSEAAASSSSEAAASSRSGPGSDPWREEPVVPAAPPEPPEPPAALPGEHREVHEVPYIAAGEGMRSDTTDTSWDDARDSMAATRSEPEPPERHFAVPADPGFSDAPSVSTVPSLGRNIDSSGGTYYPGFGVEEEEAPTVPYTASYDEDLRTAVLSEFDDQPPPTDEAPAAVLQDVGHGYSAPMHVPEPPPIPGLFDRFTPIGGPSRESEPDRPSYLAPSPAPVERSAPRPAPLPEEDTEPPAPTRMMPIAIGALLLLGFAALVVALLLLFLYQSNREPPAVVETSPPSRRTPVVEPPRPVEPPAAEPERPGPVEPRAEPPAPEADAAAVPPVAQPHPAAPSPRPAARPRRPAPRPNPRPADAVQPAVVEKGSLTIRANRAALVYVDGRAVGLTPKTVRVDGGSHTISAMLPGQPASKQTQTVEVEAGSSVPVAFTF